MSLLADHVTLDLKRHRSARIDADAGDVHILRSYVLQPSVAKAFEVMADALAADTRAFTWTGPYGGGKSSAALILANLVAADDEIVDAARAALPATLSDRLLTGLGGEVTDWVPIAITAHARSLREEIVAAAERTLKWSTSEAEAARRDDGLLVQALDRSLNGRRLLIIVDELGKSLEGSPAEGGIHLLQDLAEWASRAQGRAVLVGILHQSFERYAARADRATKEDWAKVQGRFLDISFTSGADEMVALIGQALQSGKERDHGIDTLGQAVAEAVCERRPGDPEKLGKDLAAAWPLNPVATLLLGPLSRRRFAQNERSIFGFLASAEPLGFREHLTRATLGDARDLYGPDRLWDYVVANFSNAMHGDEDGQRLAVALDAIERASARGGPAHERVAKCCAALEFFKEGTGLAVADSFVLAALPDLPNETVKAALDDLVEWAILIRQPRLGGYALFAGSDFDLDSEITRFRDELKPNSFDDLPSMVGMPALSAKRHYFRTGALRTFPLGIRLVTEAELSDAGAPARIANDLASRHKVGGSVMLLVGDGKVPTTKIERFAAEIGASLAAAGGLAAIGVARSAFTMRETIADLFALERVAREQTRLEGDRLARREVAARRAALAGEAHREVVKAFDGAQWRFSSSPRKLLPDMTASALVSKLADDGFGSAPTLQSELLQRDKPSSNAMAAVRELGHAMAEQAGLPCLGIEGYPAERGLYVTILEALGLHREVDGQWRFTDPDESLAAGRSLLPAWQALDAHDELALLDLYDIWADRPYGIKRGVMPVLAFAQLLARRAFYAVYLDGVYLPDLDALFFDRLLQDPGAVRVRKLSRDAAHLGFMTELSKELGLAKQASALDIASSLFRRFAALPEYSRRTGVISGSARTIRDVILRADDPEALLFKDLPAVAADAHTTIAALEEAEAAYSDLLAQLTSALAGAVGCDAGFAGVAARADAVAGATGDLRFDAFAQRLRSFEAGEGDIEGLVSMLVHRPARSWSDLDRQRALAELSKLGRSMREAEAFLSVRGGDSSVQSMAIVLDFGATAHISRFAVTDPQKNEAELLAERMLALIADVGDDVGLAALARAAQRLTRDREAEAA